jgi:curved DNA-binding protein
MNCAMPKVKDYYEVLGVSRNATEKEIQSAFRKLARKYHPDVNAGDKAAEQRFKEISEAHDVLSDSEKRKLYDRFGPDWKAAAAAGATADAGPGFGGGFGGFRSGGPGGRVEVDPQEFEELLRRFGGDGGGVGGFGGGVGDLFGSIFGGGARGARGRGATRPTVEAEGTVNITLREAYTGARRQVELPDGRRLEVSIPAGVNDGTVLRVPGLRARVQIAKDPTFERDGKDLRVTVAVPLRTALLGGEVEVPTPKGARVKLNVPPETQNGRRLRLRGLGMPDAKGGAAGDLYAEIKVQLPLPMDEATRRWAEQLR